jgi:hypothetical protein
MQKKEPQQEQKFIFQTHASMYSVSKTGQVQHKKYQLETDGTQGMIYTNTNGVIYQRDLSGSEIQQIMSTVSSQELYPHSTCLWTKLTPPESKIAIDS